MKKTQTAGKMHPRQDLLDLFPWESQIFI